MAEPATMLAQPKGSNGYSLRRKRNNSPQHPPPCQLPRPAEQRLVCFWVLLFLHPKMVDCVDRKSAVCGFCFAMALSCAKTEEKTVFKPQRQWVKRTVRRFILYGQYIPKGTDFSKLTDEMLAEIEWKLNHRPRKSLGYRTPLEYCKQLFNFNF